MIPKKIHYIWVGGNPLTDLAKKCIASWEKHCPDYEIIEWNESNFDINSNEFCRQAYEKKKWAFAADYMRIAALQEQGGIYMDTDMELYKSLDGFLHYPAFAGFEDPLHVNVAIMGAEKGNKWIEAMHGQYKDRKLIDDNGEMVSLAAITIPRVVSSMMEEMYPDFRRDGTLQHLPDVTVFPEDYFYPISYHEDIDKRVSRMSENTVSNHHWCGSWVEPEKLAKPAPKSKGAKVLIGQDDIQPQ